MSDDKKPFTVSDRRHFTAEGEARESEPAEGPPPPAPRAEAEPNRGAPGRRPAEDEAVPPAAPGAFAREGSLPDEDDDRDDQARPDATGELPPFPADLLGLIGSLATQATVLLAGDPETRLPPTPPELEAVRSIIALLDVLHEKTANNRNPQEDRVLDAVRYELKMAYVASTRAGGA
jgi:uncharacterized protein DUF1844